MRLKLLFSIAVAIAAGWYLYSTLLGSDDDGVFFSSNGRIEATEVDISTKLAGRVDEIFAEEGAFVKKGDILATMQIDTLEAQLREVEAQKKEAINGVLAAEAEVAMRESDHSSKIADVSRANAELIAAQKRLDRSRVLAEAGATSMQVLDDDIARAEGAKASVEVAKSQVASATSAIIAAEAKVIAAKSKVEAMSATIDRIEVEIEDSKLKAPRDGRVQYRVAQVGEVLSAGGRVMNLLELSDVYMTFFLPTEVAGRLALGADVRILLDAAPDYPISAKISFVASAAQFTPKTVETASERQKLMFRVRAQIDKDLLQKYLEHIKTGLPGEVWIRLDNTKEWPEYLEIKPDR